MLITALARTPAQVGKYWLGHHADLRHPGRKFYQPRTNAILRADVQQDHTQRLGIGWIYHTGTRRDIDRSFRADHCPAHHGQYLIFGFCRVVRQKEFGAEMKKIFAIAWKDAIIRFASSSELIFFIILPLVFTFLLAGGTPKADGGDTRMRLVVVDEANTTISQQIIAELEKSTAVRPEALTRDEAESQFDARRASVVFIHPRRLGLASHSRWNGSSGFASTAQQHERHSRRTRRADRHSTGEQCDLCRNRMPSKTRRSKAAICIRSRTQAYFESSLKLAQSIQAGRARTRNRY